MKRWVVIAFLTCGVLALRPPPAAADLTAFWGVSWRPVEQCQSCSPTVSPSKSTKGIAIGVGLIVVGFEFEYSKIAEDELAGLPGLATGMGNLVVMTPTYKLQLYGTTGGGLFHETYRDRGTTSFGSNIGGGVKIGLAGPIRLRVDYRVFNLNGDPLFKRVKRLYGGVSISF